jgi:capsular polysaccharide biosynthesis protein
LGDEKVQASSPLCSGCHGRTREEPQEPAPRLGRRALPAAAELMDWGQLLWGLARAGLVTVSIQITQTLVLLVKLLTLLKLKHFLLNLPNEIVILYG